jgi:hypothetical protein
MSKNGTTLLRFVRLRNANDYLALGWMSTPDLFGSYHGTWSVLMKWICDCEPREPNYGHEHD